MLCSFLRCFHVDVITVTRSPDGVDNGQRLTFYLACCRLVAEILYHSHYAHPIRSLNGSIAITVKIGTLLANRYSGAIILTKLFP